MKLTKAQHDLLFKIILGDAYCDPSNPTAEDLIGFGYAEWHGEYGYLYATDTGRAALEESHDR